MRLRTHVQTPYRALIRTGHAREQPFKANQACSTARRLSALRIPAVTFSPWQTGSAPS